MSLQVYRVLYPLRPHVSMRLLWVHAVFPFLPTAFPRPPDPVFDNDETSFGRNTGAMMMCAGHCFYFHVEMALLLFPPSKMIENLSKLVRETLSRNSKRTPPASHTNTQLAMVSAGRAEETLQRLAYAWQETDLHIWNGDLSDSTGFTPKHIVHVAHTSLAQLMRARSAGNMTSSPVPKISGSC